MLHTKTIWKKLAFAVATIGATFSVALQAEQQVLINLASGSGQTQGMALVLAGQMQQQGAKVSVLLCDSAGDIALKAYEGATLQPMNATPAQLMGKFRQGGGVVQVCALYLPNKGITTEALLEGITPAKPADIATLMLAPEVKVFGF